MIAECQDATSAASLLRTTNSIRTRAQALLAQARSGGSRHFRVFDPALHEAALLVAEVTRTRYPDYAIPFHSRWRHFEAGGVDRRALLDERLGDVSPAVRARAQIDLALVSVLLDAGAGPDWKYVEPASGQTFTRSEGLGVASFHAFTAGMFSSDPANPLQADAAGLRGLITDRLAQAFQVRDNNPLVGVDGRATLLRRLGEVLADQPATFGPNGQYCRPGGMFDLLAGSSGSVTTAEVSAHAILSTLLDSLSGIWPAQNTVASPERPGRASDATPLGDCWRHADVRGPGLTDGWMPFHKLSQWLTYSLLEPFDWAGVKVTGLGALTGLPEYRNGGLLIDIGILRPVEPDALARRYTAGDEFIVEWRALTVALLDELAPLVRTQLGATEDAMPLACVLEGGTWAAGRVLASRLRGGTPPLNIESDGTIF
jgi:hypothetical protein